MRRDASLYNLCPKRKCPGRGRPRKRGAALPKLKSIALHVRKWKPITFIARGKKATRLVYSREVLWYNVSKTPVLLVISRDPSGKEREDYFFYDRCGDETRRGIGQLRRPVGHRRYIQKHQAASGRGAAADMGQARPRASGGIGTLAVFDGLALVLPTALCQTNISNSAVVCEQNHPQLRRRIASLAKGFVAAANYYDVRGLCRT